MSDVAAFDRKIREELSPDLEVKRLIGTGSKASVYLARETALKRLVAVKVMKPELAADETARKRFEREAQSAAQITHPHVAAVHAVGRLESGVPYLVMEYVDGRTLEDALKAGGPMEAEEARGVMLDLARALEAAHARRIIHRDVRPANVLIERDSGRVVLTDFGLAAILEGGRSDVTRLTAEGQLLGELRYMSPELLRGERATEQADIYGLGLLGFELLTAESPYDVDREVELAAAHLRQSPRRVTALRPEVPGDLADLVERCLAKQPEHRPRAADLVRALSRPETEPGAGAREGGEPEARPSALPSFLAELKRRRVYRVAAAYLALIFIVADPLKNLLEDLPISNPGAVHTIVLAITLAGFPLALVLSWMFDVSSRGVIRTAEATEGDEESPSERRILQVVGLTLSLVLSALIGWWVLRGG